MDCEHTHARTRTQIKISSSSSCHAASTDIADPLSLLLPIVHRLRLVFMATSRILTKLLYVWPSRSSRFCSVIFSGTYTRIHIYIYINIYMCVCVCVCVIYIYIYIYITVNYVYYAQLMDAIIAYKGLSLDTWNHMCAKRCLLLSGNEYIEPLSIWYLIGVLVQIICFWKG